MNEKAFTLIEMLIILVVIGIFAAVSINTFSRLIEKSRSAEAETSLLLIYNAQKRFLLNNRAYFNCAASCTPGDIVRSLDIALQANHFSYNIQRQGTAGYIATATRKSGTCVNNTMTINDLSSEITKECEIWR